MQKTRKYEYKTVAGLLSDRNRWCKGAMAKTSRVGEACDVKEGKVFCLYGAIERVYKTPTKVGEVVRKIQSLIDNREIVDFNDSKKTTHQKVLELVKRAKV